MRSKTLRWPGDPRHDPATFVRDFGRDPDLALAFLAPLRAEAEMREIAAFWPNTKLAGVEAITQFDGSQTVTDGCVHAFWFDRPSSKRHGVEIFAVAGQRGEPFSEADLSGLASRLEEADGVLLLSDGLRFPTERFLSELRRRLGVPRAAIAGGLASQSEPIQGLGSRVYRGTEALPSACVAVIFRGFSMQIEVVRGWDPASPIYTVTRAQGNVLHEIDGEPATDWYRRFFTIDGELAPLPEASYGYPLILVGPSPERQGLYRAMRSFDAPPGSVTFWGAIEAGDQVRLGMGSEDSLVRTAHHFANLTTPPEAALLISCVGRQAVLGERAGEEVAAIHRALAGTALSGFFTFGEIGPSAGGDLAYYNQTAVLVLLTEERS